MKALAWRIPLRSTEKTVGCKVAEATVATPLETAADTMACRAAGLVSATYVLAILLHQRLVS